MKKHISTFASVAAISMIVPGVAFAQCDTNLAEVDQALDQTARSELGRSAQDVRRMRSTAQLLSDYGKDDACSQVMSAIKEIAQEGRRSQQQAQAGQDQTGRDQSASGGQAMGQNGETQQSASRQEMAANAKPIDQASGEFSLEQMNGSTVYSSTSGETVGEIEDLIIGQENERFAILAHGGFLGLGENRVKVPLTAIKVNTNDNSYYVDMTNQQLETAPKVEWSENRWVGEAVQPGQGQQQNQQKQN